MKWTGLYCVIEQLIQFEAEAESRDNGQLQNIAELIGDYEVRCWEGQGYGTTVCSAK